MQTFDLGHVIQASEAIKAMRRQESSDKLRDVYLQGQIGAQGQARDLAAAQEQRAATEFSQEQQIKNTQLLNAASAEIMQSPDPATVNRWLPQLKQAGVVSQDADISHMDPESVRGLAQHLHQSTAAALQALGMGTTAKFSNPEPGQMGGKDVFFQTDQAGNVRVIPNISPRPQKAAVEVNMGQAESAANKAFGEAEGKAFQDVLQRGMDAQNMNGTLQGMLESPAITGPTQDFRAAANSFFSDMGVPVSPERLSQISNLNQYKAMQGKLVLEELMKQKGPQTEGDAKRASATYASISNLPDANRFILKYRLALNQRESEIANIAEQYRQKTGKIDGWRQEVNKYVQSTPLAANNPKTGRLVFWNEFVEAAKEDNPGLTDEQALDIWRSKYAGRR